MGDYYLPNGRKISLVRWNMIGTYSGILEGSKEGASQSIREELPEFAARTLPPGHPLAVIRSPFGELPDWFCVAELESTNSVHNTGPDFFSRLYVCWFMGDTARSLDKVIESILPQIDWEGLAEDYDIMMF
jgi:hypothetical protein